LTPFQEWKAQQSQMCVERQDAVETARREWVGRGVWYIARVGLGTGKGCCAENVEIDARGGVHVFLGYDPLGRRLASFASLEELGSTITLGES